VPASSTKTTLFREYEFFPLESCNRPELLPLLLPLSASYYHKTRLIIHDIRSFVTGKTTMNGQVTPLAVDPSGALFADGAGTFEVIASLPLAEGYSLSFRNLDVQKQKPQIKQLKVVGTESVTVPAGTFDAYKVEIIAADNEADKQTVWIDKASRKVLKLSAVLPSLNGAILTTELMPN